MAKIAKPRKKRNGNLSFMARRRLELGLTQKRMAELLKISRSTYANYEDGRRRLPIELIKPLAQILNCSPIDFLPGA